MTYQENLGRKSIWDLVGVEKHLPYSPDLHLLFITNCLGNLKTFCVESNLWVSPNLKILLKMYRTVNLMNKKLKDQWLNGLVAEKYEKGCQS